MAVQFHNPHREFVGQDVGRYPHLHGKPLIPMRDLRGQIRIGERSYDINPTGVFPGCCGHYFVVSPSKDDEDPEDDTTKAWKRVSDIVYEFGRDVLAQPEGAIADRLIKYCKQNRTPPRSRRTNSFWLLRKTFMLLNPTPKPS